MFRSTLLFAAFAILAAPATMAYSNSQMLCLVNSERAKQGLPAMGLDALLTRAAQAHSDDQARMNSMSHTGSDGSDPGKRVTRTGFNWRSVAENVAYGYPDSNTCMTAWMNSPGHRANILGNCEMFGSAVAYSGSTPYYTQNFGTDSGGRRNVPRCDGSDSETPSSGGGGGGNYGGSNPSTPSYGNPQQPSYGRPTHQQPSYGGGNKPTYPSQNNYGNWMYLGGGGRNPWGQPSYGGGMYNQPILRYGRRW